MPSPGEYKTVQSRILANAQEIGWSFVSREEAERRGFASKKKAESGGGTFPPLSFNMPPPIYKSVDWQSLMRRDGDELETHYRHVLESLGKAKGMRGSTADQLGKPCGREQNALIRIDAR